MPRRQERKIPTQAQKVKALYDIWTFFDILSYHGGSSAFSPFHKEAVEWSERDDCLKRQLFLIPRGHLKSTIFTVGRILHRIYQNPNVRIFVGTANKFLSASFIRELKTYFEDTWLQDNVWNVRPHYDGRLVPLMDRAGRKRRTVIDDEFAESSTEAEDKKIVWRSDAIQVLRTDILKEPTVTVGSVGSIATGFHYDELYLDDVVTFDNVATADKNRRVFSWIYDLESVLDPEYFDEDLYTNLKRFVKVKKLDNLIKRISSTGAKITVVGTRYDKQDYYGHIIDNQLSLEFEVYEKNIYVNGQNNIDGYLWAERFNEQIEKRLRASLTARRFASQYLNEILADEDKVLDYDRVQFIHPSDVELDSSTRNYALIKRGDEKPRKVRLICVVDPAASCSIDADFTAIGVGGVDYDGNLYILDLRLGKWQIHQWVKVLYELLDKFNLDAVHIETVAFQLTLIQTVRSFFTTYRPVALLEYRPGNTKKEDRIEQTLSPVFSNSMIFFSTFLGGNTQVKDQIMYFPRKTMKDDAVDVISMIKEISKPPKKPQGEMASNYVSRSFNKRFGGYW